MMCDAECKIRDSNPRANEQAKRADPRSSENAAASRESR